MTPILTIAALPLQYLLLPLLVSTSFLACFVSNTLYLVAWAGYAYITVLGYMSTA